MAWYAIFLSRSEKCYVCLIGRIRFTSSHIPPRPFLSKLMISRGFMIFKNEGPIVLERRLVLQTVYLTCVYVFPSYLGLYILTPSLINRAQHRRRSSVFMQVFVISSVRPSTRGVLQRFKVPSSKAVVQNRVRLYSRWITSGGLRSLHRARSSRSRCASLPTWNASSRSAPSSALRTRTRIGISPSSPASTSRWQ